MLSDACIKQLHRVGPAQFALLRTIICINLPSTTQKSTCPSVEGKKDKSRAPRFFPSNHTWTVVRFREQCRNKANALRYPSVGFFLVDLLLLLLVWFRGSRPQLLRPPPPEIFSAARSPLHRFIAALTSFASPFGLCSPLLHRFIHHLGVPKILAAVVLDSFYLLRFRFFDVFLRD